MRAALASIIEKRGLSLSAEEVHRKYAEIEPSIQEGIGGKYVEVMRMGVEQTFRHFGVEVSEEEAGDIRGHARELAEVLGYYGGRCRK